MTKKEIMEIMDEYHEMLKRKDPLEVLSYIEKHFADDYQPLNAMLAQPENSWKYTVGDLIRDTIKENSNKLLIRS